MPTAQELQMLVDSDPCKVAIKVLIDDVINAQNQSIREAQAARELASWGSELNKQNYKYRQEQKTMAWQMVAGQKFMVEMNCRK